MKRLLASRGTTAVLVAVAMLLVAGGTYALASGGGTITVCVHKHGGALYKAKKCKKGDKKLSWNKQGRQGNPGATGAKGATGAPGAPGAAGFVQMGSWAGPVDTLPGSAPTTFLGPTTTVTTAAGQSIAASGSAALATTTGSTDIALGICIQPSAGGALTLLDPNPGTAITDVEVTTTRLSYAASAAGTPGAGSWNVGICAPNETSQAVDKNDWSIGYAFVTNGGLTAGSTSKKIESHAK